MASRRRGWPPNAATAGQPGLARQAGHHLRGARPARARPSPGARRSGSTGRCATACSTATSTSRAGRPEAGARAPVAAAAPRAGAGHARRSAATSCSTAAPSTSPSATRPPSTASRCGPTTCAPDALLLNFKSVVMTFTPDRGARRRAVALRAAAGRRATPTPRVPLLGRRLRRLARRAEGRLRRSGARALRRRLPGRLRRAQSGRWPMPTRAATPRAPSAALWREMGGTLTGQVREGRVPAGLKPAFELGSPPLAEVVRDINKYSNNVMAQQLFLTLGLQQQRQRHAGSRARRAAPVVARAHRHRRRPPVFDNGSGLSRDERISAAAAGAAAAGGLGARR